MALGANFATVNHLFELRRYDCLEEKVAAMNSLHSQ